MGTKPKKDGLVKFYMAMEGDPNIGGVSGFLGLYFSEDEPKEMAEPEVLVDDRAFKFHKKVEINSKIKKNIIKGNYVGF